MNRVFFAGFFLFLLVLQSEGIFSQSLEFTPASRDHLNLPNRPSGIITMVTDQSGVLYVATEKGLFQFDGIVFNNLLQGHPELQVFEDSYFNLVHFSKDGNLWAAIYEEGLLRIDLSKGDYDFFRHEPGDPFSLPGNRLDYIYESKGGKIWVGSNGQGFALYQPSQNNFKTWLPDPDANQNMGIAHFSNIITGLYDYPDESCNIWISTLNGLFLFDYCNQIFESYFLPANEIMEKHIRSMVYDSLHNRLLLGTWGNGLWAFNLNERSFSQVFFFENNWNQNNVRRIYPICNHHFLIATGTSGILLYDSYTDSLQWILTTSENTKIGVPSGFFMDALDNIWVSTLNSELLVSYFNHRLATKVNLARSDIIKVVFHEAADKILAVSEYSATLFILNTGHQILHEISLREKGIPASSFRRLFDIIPSGLSTFYLVSNSGVYEFDIIDHRLEKLPLDMSKINFPHTLFTSAALDQYGNLWLGTNWEGVVSFDPVSKKTTTYRHDPDDPKSLVHDSWVQCIYPDDYSRIWFGTYLGFSYLDLEKNKFVNYAYQNLPPIDRGAPFKIISSISSMSNDRVWIGNSIRGLGIIDPSKPPNLPFPTYLKTDGLGSDKIRDIFYDKSSSLTWITGEDNISIAGEHSNYQFSFFNAGTEFGIKNVSGINGFKDGKVLATANDGYYVLDYNKLQQGIKKPYLSISTVKKFHQEIPSIHQFHEGHPLYLKHNENYLSFEFKGLYYPNPAKISYRYRLVGLQDQWVNLGKRHNISFAHLGPGRYTIEVSASIDPGIWTKAVKLPFVIKPPFWKTTWFLLLLGFAVVGSGTWIYKKRINSLIKKEEHKRAVELELANIKMKALRAQMNPHFLFNCLNSVKAFIIDNDPRMAASYLNKFARLIRLILQQSNENFVKLENELEALELYIQLESVRFEGKFEYQIIISEEVKPDRIELPPMLFQPYVENAIWHGLMQKKSKGFLIVKISRKNDFLECEIEDNGIGRKASIESQNGGLLKKKSMGMGITKNRIELLQQIYQTSITLKIEDLFEKGVPIGTKVKMIFPIHEVKPTNQ